MTYTPDIFFKTEDLSMYEKQMLLIIALENSYTHHIDVLNSTESCRRKQTNISFMDMLNKVDKNTKIYVIYRKGFKSTNNIHNQWHGEIGFSTMTDPNYFLFVYVNEVELNKLVKKYNLEEV